MGIMEDGLANEKGAGPADFEADVFADLAKEVMAEIKRSHATLHQRMMRRQHEAHDPVTHTEPVMAVSAKYPVADLVNAEEKTTKIARKWVAFKEIHLSYEPDTAMVVIKSKL